MQQTPSEPQTPLAQSAPVPVHASPFALPTQVPFEQTGVVPLHPPQHAAFAMQALAQGFWPAGHVDAHVVPPDMHPNAHVMFAGAVQAPAPLHSAADVAVPLVQEAAAPQDMVVPGNTQLVRLVPSQRPTQTPVPGQGVRGVVTATQVPRLAVLTHDSHWPLQAALQHTPSEPHTPLWHSPAAAQAVPLALAGAPPVPLPAAPPVFAPPEPPVPTEPPACPPLPAEAPPVAFCPPLPTATPPPVPAPPVPVAVIPPLPETPPVAPLVPPLPPRSTLPSTPPSLPANLLGSSQAVSRTEEAKTVATHKLR